MKFVSYICRGIVSAFIVLIFFKVCCGDQSLPTYCILIAAIIGAFAADVDKSKEG